MSDLSLPAAFIVLSFRRQLGEALPEKSALEAAFWKLRPRHSWLLVNRVRQQCDEHALRVSLQRQTLAVCCCFMMHTSRGLCRGAREALARYVKLSLFGSLDLLPQQVVVFSTVKHRNDVAARITRENFFAAYRPFAEKCAVVRGH